MWQPQRHSCQAPLSRARSQTTAPLLFTPTSRLLTVSKVTSELSVFSSINASFAIRPSRPGVATAVRPPEATPASPPIRQKIDKPTRQGGLTQGCSTDTRLMTKRRRMWIGYHRRRRLCRKGAFDYQGERLPMKTMFKSTQVEFLFCRHFDIEQWNYTV